MTKMHQRTTQDSSAYIRRIGVGTNLGIGFVLCMFELAEQVDTRNDDEQHLSPLSEPYGFRSSLRGSAT